MNVEHTMVLSRAAEHILVAFIGAFAIFLGYKLFAITTAPVGSGSIEVKELLKIEFWHIYPGVFFALFGASLIGYSATHPIKYDRTSRRGADGATEDSESLQAFMSARPEAAGAPALSSVPCEQLIKTLAEMANELGTTAASAPRKQALRDARVCLMLNSWKDEWGRRNLFQDWVYNSGEMNAFQTSIARAVAVYRGTAQG